MKAGLILVAGLFAIVAGANDGSSILSTVLRVPGFRPLTSICILLGSIAIGPWLLFGTGVATTLAQHLVPFSGPREDAVVLVAILSSIAVVFTLTRVGSPTSLTLSLIGAITGAAFGSGLPIHAVILAEILAVGLLAPVMCAFLAFLAAPVVLRALHAPEVTKRLRRAHQGAFCLQCLGYSANGGQKMLAVFAIATGAASGRLVRDPWWLALVVSVFFGAGILIGLRRVSERLGKEVVTVRLRHAVVAESCSFAVVMGAGLAGVPLTMSQSVTGALVGAGARESLTRVRWSGTAGIALAWAVTLPASVALAAGAAGATRLL